MRSPVKIYDSKDGQPPQIERCLGLKVTRASVLSGKCLLLLLEKEMVLRLERVPSVGDMGAVFVGVGRGRPGFDWSFLDATPQDEFLATLPGMRIRGMDANTLEFDAEDGKIYGVGFEFDHLVYFMLP
jgi:hypothetical protein